MDISVTTLANSTITTAGTTSIGTYIGIILLALAGVPVIWFDLYFLIIFSTSYRPNKN